MPGRDAIPLERNVCLIFLLLSSTATSGLQVPTMSGPQVHRTHHRRKAPQSTTLYLIKGIEPSVEDEINREVEEANMSNIELIQKELENGSNIFQAIGAVSQRRKDKSGDYENKFKFLSDKRSYGNADLLMSEVASREPVLDDLNQIQPDKMKVIWASSPFRLSVFVAAFFVFPILCQVLSTLVEINDDEFDIINEQFTPGVGILYGTFVALTLDILYERQGKVQENASIESSLLSMVTQNVLNLFRDEPEIAREASQIIADQVRIITYRSRGSEMLSIMRADPYARLLSLVDHYHRDKTSFTPQQEALIDTLRGDLPGLMDARARRLSDEASSLPPTHFLVLVLLTSLSLIGFTAATLTITDETGKPPLESRMVFAGLSAVYVLFFNFCKDMNDPFDGVYQIKRSSAASYLMQIKWLIANQSFGKQVKFDSTGMASVYDGDEFDPYHSNPPETTKTELTASSFLPTRDKSSLEQTKSPASDSREDDSGSTRTAQKTAGGSRQISMFKKK